MAALLGSTRALDTTLSFSIGLIFRGTSGDDTQDGTGGGDLFKFQQGGTDTLNGEKGDDTFQMGGALDGNDSIDGGGGSDTVVLHGDYSSPFNFSHVLIHVEKVVLLHGSAYDVTFSSISQTRNATLTIDASDLRAADPGRLFGADTGHNEIIGGAGGDDIVGGEESDVLRGGDGDDYLVGLLGADHLFGGAGRDRFDLSAPESSSSTAHDTIFGFDAREDKIALNRAVAKMGHAVDSGALNSASFDTDMKAALGHAALRPSHAVLFTPDSGDLAGHVFLVVDNNGVGGYQPNKDYVVELVNAHNLDALHANDFLVAL